MVRTLIGPHLVTTNPGVMRCKKCNRLVLAATVRGFDRQIDPTALNDMGELQALIEGRKTYELHGEMIIPRSVARIGSAREAETPVLADHGCKDTPVSYVEPDHMMRAFALCQTLLGTTIIDETDGNPPPF